MPLFLSFDWRFYKFTPRVKLYRVKLRIAKTLRVKLSIAELSELNHSIAELSELNHRIETELSEIFYGRA